MTLRKPNFLLDIRVEFSKTFTDEYEVTAKSENLFCVSLINIRRNVKKAQTKDKTNRRSAQRKSRKIIPRLCRACEHEEYGRSILITKTAGEIYSDMKTHDLKLSLKSKTNSDTGIGTMLIPWSKSLINYLNNTTHTKLSPVSHKEKLNVVDRRKNICAGSIDITIKLMSLESNFYKFITSTKNNIRIYRNLFSNPKVLEIENSTMKSKCKNASDEYDKPAIRSCDNRSDTTYNIIESTENKYLLRPANKTPAKIETNFEKATSLHDGSFYEKNKNLNELEISEKGVNKSDKGFESSFGDTAYCINYFTINKSPRPIKALEADSSERSTSSMETITVNKKITTIIAYPVLNLKSKPSQSELCNVEVTSCHDIACFTKKRHVKLPVYDNSLALDLSTLYDQCCSSYKQKSSTNLKFDDHPCYCTCECKFEIIKETTYCKICGGYEIIGEEFVDTRGQEMPMPCPIFHKFVEKNKLKSRSSSGSIRRRKGDGSSRSIKSSKSSKSSKSTKSSTPKTSEKRLKLPEKKIVQQQPEKETKKKKVIKLKQINYGYRTPHAGHGGCVNNLCLDKAPLKCNVPKCMGWFWTADNVHGMKYRPTWRPGAAEKHVVHLLQMARHPKQIISKKKKKELAKAKRPLKRPLLVVHKKDGEFTVTMETMKTSMKPREVYEQPYEDKPLLTYTIGRTEEENKERQKQKLRKQRRLEREQRTYLQSAFKNMCQEICLKTCQQALGILPEAEDKQGLCYANTQWIEPENPNPSCACSENSLSVSDTDSDEWILEFTPPNALFDPSRKGKKIVKIEKDTQYVPPQS